MEAAASKGVRGSVSDGLAPNGPQGHVPAGGCENGVEGPKAVYGGGEEEVTSGTSVFDGQVALRNPVVLTRLFEVCPPGDLSKFRLVSKDWYDLSLKIWRASFTLKLERNAADGGLYLKGAPLDEFLEYVEDPGTKCGAKPFRRMKLDGWILDPGNNQIQRFWNLLGGELTSLKFRRCRFPSVAEFRRLIYTACPNLSVLSFLRCEFDEVDVSVYETSTHFQEPAFGERLNLKFLSIKGICLPVSWLELFSHFQSLTVLKQHRLCAPRPPVEAMWERMLNAISAVRRRNPLKLPLKQFDIAHQSFQISRETASQDKFFWLIRKLNLRLKSLDILLHPDLDDRLVNDILQFHSGTLEHIHLVGEFRQEGEPEPPRRKFHCRVQLEKVTNLWIEHVLFQSIGILKCVPNLESLLIDEDCSREGTRATFQGWMEELERNEAVKLPNLRHLDYFLDNEFGPLLDLVELESLTKLFPNLEYLQMPLDDEHFAVVCRNWKGLKELMVNGDEYGDEYHLTDKGLTGTSPRRVWSDWIWKQETVHPNIKDLIELRSFTCRSNKLTDISVYNGLLQLPQLKSVRLSRNRGLKGIGFGEQAERDLREKGVELTFE